MRVTGSKLASDSKGNGLPAQQRTDRSINGPKEHNRYLDELLSCLDTLFLRPLVVSGCSSAGLEVGLV